MQTQHRNQVNHHGSQRITSGQLVLALVMLFFVLVCSLPFLNVIAISLSSKSAILRGDVSLWPKEFTYKAYEVIMQDKSMWHSLFYTVRIQVAITQYLNKKVKNCGYRF